MNRQVGLSVLFLTTPHPLPLPSPLYLSTSHHHCGGFLLRRPIRQQRPSTHIWSHTNAFNLNQLMGWLKERCLLTRSLRISWDPWFKAWFHAVRTFWKSTHLSQSSPPCEGTNDIIHSISKHKPAKGSALCQSWLQNNSEVALLSQHFKGKSKYIFFWKDGALCCQIFLDHHISKRTSSSMRQT